MGDDGVMLTEGERRALAGLAEQIGDPWLARQLVGQESAPPDAKRGFAGSILHRLAASSAPGWVGLFLLLAGTVLLVTTFAYSTVLGALGLVAMGAGLWRLLIDQGDVILGRWSARRAPVLVPSPPRTPPAAS